MPLDRIDDTASEAEKKAKTPYDLQRIRLERLTENIVSLRKSFYIVIVFKVLVICSINWHLFLIRVKAEVRRECLSLCVMWLGRALPPVRQTSTYLEIIDVARCSGKICLNSILFLSPICILNERG